MGLPVSVAQPTLRQKIVYSQKPRILIECYSSREKKKVKVPCYETNREIVLPALRVIRLWNTQQQVSSMCAHCYKVRRMRITSI